MIFFLIIFSFFVSSCSFDSPLLVEVHVLQSYDSFQIGDIIIVGGLSWPPWLVWGHSALVINSSFVVEVNHIGDKVHLTSIEDWFQQQAHSNLLVLRYRYQTSQLQEALKMEAYSSLGRPYNAIQLKKFNKAYYCSSLIWSIYYEAGKSIGKVIDLDGNSGFFVFPSDFLESDLLEMVPISIG